MIRRLNDLLCGESEFGATAVEYVLMVTMIALVVIGGAAMIGTNLIPFFSDASSGF